LNKQYYRYSKIVTIDSREQRRSREKEKYSEYAWWGNPVIGVFLQCDRLTFDREAVLTT
jgi:hypothetical protein